MKIAINATFRIQGGAELHLRRLLNAWYSDGLDRIHDFTVFTLSDEVESLQIPSDSRFRVHTLDFRVFRRLLWEQTQLPGIVSDGCFDVLFCPQNIVPLRCSVPSVVAFQNIAPFADEVTLWRTGAHRYFRFGILGSLMRLSAKAAKRIIFPSHHIQSVFEKKCGSLSQKADVIYFGRDSLVPVQSSRRMSASIDVESPYILCVSHLYRYKNIPELIRGYALASNAMREKGLRLVIVGKQESEAFYRELRALISQLDLNDWVKLPGPVPYSDIAPLMAGCEFFVFQSVCETCPNALIEALAAGAPVMSSNASVMPELAGKAALYFDPFSPEDISRALIRMAEDSSLRAELRAGGPRQTLNFPTWSEVSKLTIQSLERAANVRPLSA